MKTDKVIVMMDDRMIEMLREVRNHPNLVARMEEAERQGAKAHSTIFTTPTGHDDIPLIQSFEQAIGFLAAEVGIALHGDYSHEDLCRMCLTIMEDLIKKRTVVLNTVAADAPSHSPIILPDNYKLH